MTIGNLIVDIKSMITRIEKEYKFIDNDNDLPLELKTEVLLQLSNLIDKLNALMFILVN